MNSLWNRTITSEDSDYQHFRHLPSFNVEKNTLYIVKPGHTYSHQYGGLECKQALIADPIPIGECHGVPFFTPLSWYNHPSSMYAVLNTSNYGSHIKNAILSKQLIRFKNQVSYKLNDKFRVVKNDKNDEAMIEVEIEMGDKVERMFLIWENCD